MYQNPVEFALHSPASAGVDRSTALSSAVAPAVSMDIGLANVQEQVDIIRANYAVTGIAEHVQQDIEDGSHHIDTSHLQDITAWLAE